MKYEIENQKIKNILDELGEEYKDKLVEKVMFEYNEYDINQINLPTLLRHDSKAKEQLSNDERRARRNRMLSMMSVVGLLYTVVGLMVFLYVEFLDSKMNPEMLVAFVSIFAGLFASLMPLAIKNLPFRTFKNRDTSKYFDADIVNLWKKLEVLLIQLTPTEDDSSLDGMIKHLTRIKLLNADDVVSIKQLLQLRNQVVHSNVSEREYPTNELKDLLNSISKIINKLKQFEES